MRSVERTDLRGCCFRRSSSPQRRQNGAAELEYACRWATGWLHRARRLVAGATREEGVLLLDSGSPLGVESVQVQALELFLRRAGLRVLLLSAGLAEGRFRSALRALEPSAVVICGSEARLDVLAEPLRAAAQRRRPRVRLYGYRAARLVAGRDGVPSLGDEPGEATDALLDGALLAAPRRPGAHRQPGAPAAATPRSQPRASFVPDLRKLAQPWTSSARGNCTSLAVPADKLLVGGVGAGYQPLPTLKFAPICGASTQVEKGSWKQAQRFLNVSEAAEFLGVSAASLRKWSDQGIVPVYRTPGGQRRYAPEDLEQFLASMRQPSPRAVGVPHYGRNANSITG